MFKKILIGLVVLIVTLVIVVVMQPEDFRITRSATFNASPSAVFAQVNDLHKWEGWSPWAKIDPNAKVSYTGSPEGVGASFSWAGNNDVGEGTMTITESRPIEYIKMDLAFLKPFKGNNLTEFTFKPQGDQTQITWTMSGKNNFISKAFGLIMNCDKMVGGQFEKGLASLKSIVESAPKQ
jgi:hypothetical protein